MNVNFACTGCGIKMSAPESMFGDYVECPKCHISVLVPSIPKPKTQPPPPPLPSSPSHGHGSPPPAPSQASSDDYADYEVLDDAEDEDGSEDYQKNLRPIRLGKMRVGWRIVTGKVQGVRKEAVTHVRGSGVVYHGSGYASVNSSIERSMEFFIASVDGSEEPYFVPDDSVMIRDGHVVSAIHAVCGDDPLAAIVNHTTRKTYIVCSAEELVKHFGLASPRWWPNPFEIILLLLGLILFLFVAAGDKSRDSAVGNFALVSSLLMLGGCLISLEIRHSIKKDRFASALYRRIRAIVASLKP